MSLEGIFDPMVRAYFAGQCSGSPSNQKLNFLDMVGKQGEAVETPEVGTLYYIGKDTIKKITAWTYILDVTPGEERLFVIDFRNGEITDAGDATIIMKEGMFILSFPESAELTPEELGLPGYGTYVNEAVIGKDLILLSYEF